MTEIFYEILKLERQIFYNQIFYQQQRILWDNRYLKDGFERPFITLQVEGVDDSK